MRVLLLTIALAWAGFTGHIPAAIAQNMNTASPVTIQPDTFVLMDSARSRAIPVAIFRPLSSAASPELVILSHGYGANDPESYLTYRSICNFLALQGYMVISIQHELPTDALLPMEGKPQIVRRPCWERGADNIRFVIQYARQHFTRECNTQLVTLIGHSNGGDMSALFARKYPGMIYKLITLDNRRMALPRTRHPRVYSLRSSDQPADEGVLPGVSKAWKLGMRIIKLPATIHNDMDDGGTPAQRAEINRYILEFMNEK